MGGGQLARMLALAAHHMGFEPHIYSEKKDDPAQQVVSNNWVGPMNDEKELEKFLSKMDVATFESEFLDSDLMNRLSTETKCPIYPSPNIMGQFQDRLTQKMLLDKSKIPTAPWLAVGTKEQALDAFEKLKLPLVFKKRRGGYDGYGTFVVKTEADLNKFIEKEITKEDNFIAEKWIPFKRELACIFARNVSGEIFHYPLVESLQKDSRCFWVKGPIKHPKFAKFASQFKKLLNQANYVGVIGVELFDTPKGLIVNELAPRVHNTGHYTMDAFTTGQFELHIKALFDQPFKGIVTNTKGFAMVNLLGADPQADQLGWILNPTVRFHWYGKKDSRPGRKMGHINTLDSSPNTALKKALQALKGFKV